MIVYVCSQYSIIHFTQGEYRNDLIHLWHEKLTEFGVPHGKSTSLIATLGDPVKIRSWQIAGTCTLFSLELLYMYKQSFYLNHFYIITYTSNSVCIRVFQSMVSLFTVYPCISSL